MSNEQTMTLDSWVKLLREEPRGLHDFITAPGRKGTVSLEVDSAGTHTLTVRYSLETKVVIPT
jgi:hypothetical protein